MKKILLISTLLTLCSSLLIAAPKYISPNNDGIQDNLEIKISISDKRFIQGWSLEIIDENKNPIRTIENKVALPEKIGFKSFFKQIVTPKKGVDVPEVVVWNGAMNNGETAPDGLYYYYITATDDNGNTAKTTEREVIVDTIAPEIEITQPSDKIFGEGAKSTLKIRQSGSKEDLWVGIFKSSDGNVVKTVEWSNSEPMDFIWSGDDNEGNQVMDGVYSYEISATDRSGNVSTPASITNIIYSGDKPSTNIYVEGPRYFSPNTDSKLSNVKFELLIQLPEERTGNKLVEWNVTIRDEKKNVVKTFNNVKNGEVPPSFVIFDGIGDNGKQLPDGKYQASVSAKYINGYVPSELFSPIVVLDTEKPIAQIQQSDKIFGAGAKDNVTYSIMIAPSAGAPVKQWKGEIKNVQDNSVIKSYDFGEFPPEKVTWNGISDDGNIAEKGEYIFEITGEDLAGNVGGGCSSSPVTFDTTETQLLLAVSDEAFSPNGDNIKDVIKFTPVTATKDVVSYDFSIKDGKDNVVYSINKKGKLPVAFEWNGIGNDKVRCSDGKYRAFLSVVAANGSEASSSTDTFVLDTVAPKLTAETPWNYFSTRGNGAQKNIPVTIKDSTNEKLWNVEVRNNKDAVIASYSWSGTKDNFEWDGTDHSGNTAPDGVYSIMIFSTDDAGNSFITELKDLTLDNRETTSYIIAEYSGISPNNDDYLDSQIFSINTSVKDSIQSWSFNVRKDDGTSVYSISDKDSSILPAEITWNGADKDGNACEGTFKGTLDITYLNSNTVSAVSAPFICTATAPALSVRTFPEYFSPDNDGVDDDLFIQLTGSTMSHIKNWSFVIKDPKGKDFWRTSGKATITERIIWDGLSNVQKDRNGNAERVQSAMDYPYVFTVTDDLGMTSVVEGIIPVDVLVIRVGDVLKMAVPSIIFESDSANFMNVSEKLKSDKVDKNVQILDRIAEILKKFSDYKVTIVGHANKITEDPREELEDNLNVWGRALTPLSKERADAIKDYLVAQGVKESVLSTEGMGGTQPVANPKDKDNNWKNRRVEFILAK